VGEHVVWDGVEGVECVEGVDGKNIV